jgi:hypothetical protein
MKYRDDLKYIEKSHYVYDMHDFEQFKIFAVAIPSELNYNKIVFKKLPVVKSNFNKLQSLLKDAEVQKSILNQKHLDIEKKPYIKQLVLLKELMFECREEMNKDLSPYNWIWVEYEDADLLVLDKYLYKYEDNIFHKICSACKIDSKWNTFREEILKGQNNEKTN